METSLNPKDATVLSDEPRLSSAALATTFVHINSTFAPEFTHQCLDGEIYRGYRPPRDVVKKASAAFNHNNDSILHASHRHHSEQTPTLQVQIRLAPSGRQCQVTLVHEDDENVATANQDEVDVPPQKKVKMDRMSDSEILQAIQKALPDFTDSVDDDFLNHPVGDVVEEYQVRPRLFVMSLAEGTDEHTAAYHHQVQRLALWLIENADDVNVQSTPSASD